MIRHLDDSGASGTSSGSGRAVGGGEVLRAIISFVRRVHQYTQVLYRIVLYMWLSCIVQTACVHRSQRKPNTVVRSARNRTVHTEGIVTQDNDVATGSDMYDPAAGTPPTRTRHPTGIPRSRFVPDGERRPPFRGFRRSALSSGSLGPSRQDGPPFLAPLSEVSVLPTPS